MNKALIALAIGGFGIGLTEFVIMGILPEVAEGLAISIPRAGHFISAYALGVVVGAPTLTALGNKWPAHRVLLLLMGWFTLFNSLSALAWNYESMLALRFLSGLPHGAYFGIGAVVATSQVKPVKAASAIAILFSGFTLANVIGVPTATYAGQQLRWGSSFLIVGAVGVIALISIFAWVPVLKPGSSSGFLADLKILKNPEIWLVILLCIIGSGAFFAWYSYIAPLVTEVAGHPKFMVSVAMTLAGIGMAIGNFFGARLAEKFSPLHAIIIILVVLVILFLANSFLAHNKILVLLLTFCIGTAAFSMSSPIQLTMIQTSKNSETLGASINQSAFNIGNAIGAYTAGIPIAMGFGFTSADLVAAGFAGSGLLVCSAILALRNKRR
ncbi:MAG: MFS transporter [Cyclobacteriaceae bacterium]